MTVNYTGHALCTVFIRHKGDKTDILMCSRLIWHTLLYMILLLSSISIFRLVSLKIDKNYVELKNIVIKTERRILNVLGFVVHVQHPHKLIYAYMHVLKILDRKDILYKAW